MSNHSRSASVIVPAYREAPNIEALTQRLFAAAAPRGWTFELIIVDDNSRDGTDEIVAGLAPQFDVRLIVRQHERGLSSAVLAGFAQARFERLAVMDADLQHPPEIMPTLVEKLDDPGCDFVIATRYGGSGGVDSDWPLFRRVASRLATLSARGLAPLSDPMSGCFALTKSTLRKAKKLDPLGYKIALELYVKCGCRRPCEVPFQFAAQRQARARPASRKACDSFVTLVACTGFDCCKAVSDAIHGCLSKELARRWETKKGEKCSHFRVIVVDPFDQGEVS